VTKNPEMSAFGFAFGATKAAFPVSEAFWFGGAHFLGGR
jgi:hypothetical protein